MATLIQTGPDSFIAGDPPVDLPDGHDWCPSCGGDGLEYDWNGDLTLCFECYGMCTLECTDTACVRHSSLHPVQQNRSE